MWRKSLPSAGIARTFTVLALVAPLCLLFAAVPLPAAAQDNSNFNYGADLGQALVSGAESATGVNEENDAGLYLGRDVAKESGRLSAYTIERQAQNQRLVPGLAGIANHVRREQANSTETFHYSLSDAMADALWRKQVVNALENIIEEDGARQAGFLD